MEIQSLTTSTEEFETYELVDAKDKDDNTVKIKQVHNRVTLERINADIASLESKIADKTSIRDKIIALNSK